MNSFILEQIPYSKELDIQGSNQELIKTVSFVKRGVRYLKFNIPFTTVKRTYSRTLLENNKRNFSVESSVYQAILGSTGPFAGFE